MPRLFSDTLKDNILMGLAEDKVDLEAAIRAAVLEHDLAELEHGLDTVVGPRGVKLSGGQRQRTAVARLFVREPEGKLDYLLETCEEMQRLWEGDLGMTEPEIVQASA